MNKHRPPTNIPLCKYLQTLTGDSANLHWHDHTFASPQPATYVMEKPDCLTLPKVHFGKSKVLGYYRRGLICASVYAEEDLHKGMARKQFLSTWRSSRCNLYTFIRMFRGVRWRVTRLGYLPQDLIQLVYRMMFSICKVIGLRRLWKTENESNLITKLVQKLF